MKTKHITIHRMSSDSIDVLDTIEIEVEIKEAVYNPFTDHYETPDAGEPAEVLAIHYQGVEVSHLIHTMFSDEDLIDGVSDLETEHNLTGIKEFTQ